MPHAEQGFTSISHISRIPSKIDSIPEEAGVYYFYNEKGDLIYIGKSKNLHKRVNTHLSDNTSGRAMEMRDNTADISWETTGSELIALLRESFEIKQNKPYYNRCQRRSSFQYHVGICRGACCGKEPPSDHNARALRATGEFVYSRRNFFIIDRGRSDEGKIIEF